MSVQEKVYGKVAQDYHPLKLAAFQMHMLELVQSQMEGAVVSPVQRKHNVIAIFTEKAHLFNPSSHPSSFHTDPKRVQIRHDQAQTLNEDVTHQLELEDRCMIQSTPTKQLT